MKSLTLFKPTKHIQLGHLYEHLYCDRIVEYLFDKGVFASVDYMLDGRMYHGGVMTIEFVAYSQIAIDCLNELPCLSITISEDSIRNGQHQLESEFQENFGYTSIETVAQGLRTIHETAWVTFDELDTIDLNDVRRQTKPFYVTSERMKSTHPLFINFRLGSDFIRDHRDLLPLANRLFSIIGLNTQFYLTRAMGLYFDDEIMRYDKKSLTYQLKFKTYSDFTLREEELSGAIAYVTSQLQSKEALTRLLDQLSSIPPSQEYWVGPPIQWLYESSLQVVGAEGWKRVSTEPNLQKILQNIHIESQSGRQKTPLS